MLLYTSLSFFLFLLHKTDSLEMKSLLSTEEQGKEIIGTPLQSSNVDVPTKCAMVCLANSCRAYHVITSEDDLLCEVFGNEPGAFTRENTNSVLYGKSKQNK